MSIWWLLLALIPLAVFILVISIFLPSNGRLRSLFESFVGSILFFPPFGASAPNLTFIQVVLASLTAIAFFVGINVSNDTSKDVSIASMPLDKQIMVQAKIWRNQRNLYLTCLALALWCMVFATFTYKRRIAELEEKLAAALGGGRSSSSSSSGVIEHETAQPIDESTMRKRAAVLKKE